MGEINVPTFAAIQETIHAAVNAAFMPATPAPTTATFRLATAGSSWLAHASRPVAGLTEQQNSRWASTQW